MARRRARRPLVDITDLDLGVSDPESCGIIEALSSLPEKYKTVLALYYIEGYRVGDIAKMIGKTDSAVKMRLKKGRGLLEEKYRKEYL